jgi:hypothetical protein
MALTKQEREQGYRQHPQPPSWAEPILRRIAGGYLLLTMQGEKEALASYDSGAPIWMEITKNGKRVKQQMGGDTVALWVTRRWLIPIKGESLFEDGPPQRYRARTIADGPLPRIVDPSGRPYWAMKSGVQNV